MTPDASSNKTIPLIALVGPTSSGKSELAVKIAKNPGKYFPELRSFKQGEVISADSRQVYIGMDIGTGKVPNQELGIRNQGLNAYHYKNIPHWGIDIANPKRQYSVSMFKKYAEQKIKEIHERGHLPILCGGTGHWIDAVVFNQHLPEVKPNLKLRKELDKHTTEQLFTKLKKLDPTRAANIDPHNKRRLIRALEIITATGKPIPSSPPLLARRGLGRGSDITTHWLGINPGFEILDKKIEHRLDERIKQGMLDEVKKLRASGISWKKLESFGLEYKFCSLLLQKKITEQEFKPLLLTAIKQYSRRQMTWWRKNKDIVWI